MIKNESKSAATERLKFKLLDVLALMTPNDLQAYWQQAKWPKPDLVALSKSEFVTLRSNGRGTGVPSVIFAPIRYALTKLPPDLIASASNELDPYGWLLRTVCTTEWSKFCRDQHAPWMARVWLAAASQLLAERRLVFKAHGWSDTWEELRKNPKSAKAAQNHFIARLRHANEPLRQELSRIKISDLSETAQRQLRRARSERGKRLGASMAEKFLVQHWHELPHGLPGLCFFSDSALEEILLAFGLLAGGGSSTKQVRTRLGLIQAGVKRHFIESVIQTATELRLNGAMAESGYRFKKGSSLKWGKRQIWPQP